MRCEKPDRCFFPEMHQTRRPFIRQKGAPPSRPTFPIRGKPFSGHRSFLSLIWKPWAPSVQLPWGALPTACPPGRLPLPALVDRSRFFQNPTEASSELCEPPELIRLGAGAQSRIPAVQGQRFERTAQGPESGWEKKRTAPSRNWAKRFPRIKRRSAPRKGLWTFRSPSPQKAKS